MSDQHTDRIGEKIIAGLQSILKSMRGDEFPSVTRCEKGVAHLFRVEKVGEPKP